MVLLSGCGADPDAARAPVGPLGLSGKCADPDLNAAIQQVTTQGGVQALLSGDCADIESSLAGGDGLGAGLAFYQLMVDLIAEEASIGASLAVQVQQAGCDLVAAVDDFECPPWLPSVFPDGVAIALGEGSPLNASTPEGGENVAATIFFSTTISTVHGLAITRIPAGDVVGGGLTSDCTALPDGINSPFECDDNTDGFDTNLFPPGDFIPAGSSGLSLAADTDESRFGMCNVSDETVTIVTAHEEEVIELPPTTAAIDGLCTNTSAFLPEGIPSFVRGAIEPIVPLFTARPLYAATKSALAFANSPKQGGEGLRQCTISGIVTAPPSPGSAGITVTVSLNGDLVTTTTTDNTGFYSATFNCPNESNTIYTVDFKKTKGNKSITGTFNAPPLNADTNSVTLDVTLTPGANR